jgi:hypothetical protein
MASLRCRFCGSDQVSAIPWRDLLAERLHPETTFIFDGPRPIPKTLPFCASCGAWLPSSIERTQTEELIAALRLITALPELAAARLGHSDKPDIHLHLNDRIYGLELTRIARGGQEEIRRAEWQKDVEREARLMMRARGTLPVWVSLYWRPEPPQNNVKVAAQLLVDFVEQRLDSVANVDDRFMVHLAGRDFTDSVALYLSSLTMAHARNGKDDSWVSGFGNNPDVQPDELQNEINKKASKAADYNPPAGGLWLLIYAESSNAAQALDVAEEAHAASYTGPFDRVFFLDCMDRAAELLMNQSPARDSSRNS